jgi:excisionase family DNA binding protein
MTKKPAHQAVAVDRDCQLLTPVEVGDLLRTSRKAVYTMIERRQLPGVVKLGRRVLVKQACLIEFLDRDAAPSLTE